MSICNLTKSNSKQDYRFSYGQKENFLISDTSIIHDIIATNVTRCYEIVCRNESPDMKMEIDALNPLDYNVTMMAPFLGQWWWLQNNSFCLKLNPEAKFTIQVRIEVMNANPTSTGKNAVKCVRHLELSPFVVIHPQGHLLPNRVPGQLENYVSHNIWKEKNLKKAAISGYELELDEITVCAFVGCAIAPIGPFDEVHIYADSLIISSPLIIFGSKLIIQARKLTFRSGGYISMKLEDITFEPEARQTGIKGMDGGTIIIMVNEPIVVLDKSRGEGEKILDVRGGRGQIGGSAKIGENGKSMDSFSTAVRIRMNNYNDNINDCVYLAYFDMTDGCGHYSEVPYRGILECPTDGGDATETGKSGNGGNGGEISVIVHSAFNCGFLEQLSFLTGGEAGAPGRGSEGGKAGTPRKASYCQAWCVDNYCQAFVTGCPERCSEKCPNKCVPTKDGAPTSFFPLGSKGNNGTFKCIDNAKGNKWISKVIVDIVLLRVTDMLRIGDEIMTKEAEEIMEMYLEFLRNYEDSDKEQKWTLIYISKFESYRIKLSTNMDFYGNPYNIVPYLSYEENRQILKNELKSESAIIYMCLLIEKTQSSAEENMKNSKELFELLTQQLQDTLQSLRKLKEDKAALETELKSLQDLCKQYEENIKTVDNVLAYRAKLIVERSHEKSCFDKSLGLLFNVMKFVPVGQPYLAEVGAIGNEFLKMKDGDSSVLDGLGSLYDAYHSKQDDTLMNIAEDLSNTDVRSFDGILKGLKDFQGSAAKVSEVANYLRNTNTQRNIPENEVNALFQTLRSNDPSIMELQTNVKEFMEKQKQLYSKHQRLTQKIIDTTTNLGTVMQHLHNLREQLYDDAKGLLSHSTLRSIVFIRAQAEERIQKWQYWMGHAYKYRFGKPYPSQPIVFLQHLRDGLIKLIEKEPNMSLSQSIEATNAVFENLLREEVMSIMDFFETRPSSLTSVLPIHIFPMDPYHTLEIFNKERRIQLDLIPFLKAHEMMQTIRDIDVNIIVNQTNYRFQPISDILTIRIEHSREFMMLKDGRWWSFVHGPEESVSDCWIFKYDLIENKMIKSQRSPSHSSIINELTDSVENTRLKFEEPALASKLLISIEDDAAKAPYFPTLSEFHLKIDYNFFTAPPNECWLYIKSIFLGGTEEVRPLILIDQKDLNDCDHGYGSFNRIYSCGTSLTLEAEALGSNFEFQCLNVNHQIDYNIHEDRCKNNSATIKLRSTMYVTILYMQKVTLRLENVIDDQSRNPMHNVNNESRRNPTAGQFLWLYLLVVNFLCVSTFMF